MQDIEETDMQYGIDVKDQEQLDREVEDLVLALQVAAPSAQATNAHDQATRIRAATALIVKGSPIKASRYSGVPVGTIQKWKKQEWFQEVLHIIRKQQNDELDAAQTAVIREASEVTIDRLRNGDWKQTRDGGTMRVPVSAVDATRVMAMTFDKRALGRGDPTSRTEKLSTEAMLTGLANKFKDMVRLGEEEKAAMIKTKLEGNTYVVDESE